MSTLDKPTLIVGSGACAKRVIEQLSAAGTQLLVLTADDHLTIDGTGSDDAGNAAIETLTNTTIHRCLQKENTFHLNFTCEGNAYSRTVSSIIVAGAERRSANFSLYGLRPSNRVIPLSEAIRQAEIESDALLFSQDADNIVFLTSLFSESNPVIAAEVMQTALRLQTHSRKNKKPAQTYILMKNLKVAGDHLEALYRETKQAGTVYIKFTHTLPEIDQTDNDVLISFTDEVTGLPFRLTPGITVVDETISAPDRTDDLSALFGLEKDDSGFAQADNVHRLPVFTNRNGIFIAGASRDILSPQDQIRDADNAALADLAWLKTPIPPADEKAVIDKGKCVRCLTCYRLCPYHAISLDVYPEVMPAACERCGICAAECPQHAIDIRDLGRQEMIDRFGDSVKALSDDRFSPYILVFGCSRSGNQAARLAALMGSDLPEHLKIIEVPCAGSLSLGHILSGYQHGADGIMVLTCHEGNCHSRQGNTHAHNRIDHLKTELEQIGYDSQRLEIHTIASNMGAEFAALIQDFAKKTMKIGPSPLGYSANRPAVN